MKTRTKVITSIIALILSAVLLFVAVAVNNNTGKTNVMRTISLSESNVEYATFFNEFEDAELIIDEENNSLKFSGTQTLSTDILSGIDLISSTDNEEGVDIRYIFDYNADNNEFYLSVIADTQDGVIIDDWYGVPFVTEDSQIDIAFATDDGIIYLSDLEESGILENCGWFSKLLKGIAIAAAVVAAIAVVAAVVVVAAPAVTAAATTVGTAVAVGGGTAALTGGTATAAVAAAATAATAATTTTAFTVATTTAVVAGTTAISAYLGAQVFESLKEKVEKTAIELAKLKKYEGTMIFRADLTGNANKTLTPRPIDTKGLSFFNNIEKMFDTLRKIEEGVYITTTRLISKTGMLKAQKDGLYHYSVRPLNGNMSEWIATYSNAKTNPHKYTQALKEVCYYVPGI